MTRITLPDETPRRLAFYLAMEEYLATHLEELGLKDACFTWTTGPTVIIGNNQDLEAEVNVPFCKDHGIDIVRRKSGGGCVYSDQGNLMISYVTAATDVSFNFETFLSYLTFSLCMLGLDAERTGHNDILVAGHKVSGNACYALPSSSIVHGTMLFSTDFDMMEKAITPSEEKLSSKGIKSVRQRVTNLCDELSHPKEKVPMPLPRTISDMKIYMENFLSNETLQLNESQLAEICEIEKTYYGRTIQTDLSV